MRPDIIRKGYPVRCKSSPAFHLKNGGMFMVSKEKIEEYRTCYNNQKEYNKHRISDYDGGCCGYIGGNCKQCIFRSLESEDFSMFGDTDELVYDNKFLGCLQRR